MDKVDILHVTSIVRQDLKPVQGVTSQDILPQSAEQRINKSGRKRTNGNKVDGEKLTAWRMVKMMNMLLLWDSVNHGTGVDQRWSIYKLEVSFLMEFSSTQDHHVISLIRRHEKN